MKWLTRYFPSSTSCDLINLFLSLDLRFPITKIQGALGQMCLRSLFGSLLCFHSSALGKGEDWVLYVARKSDFYLPLSDLCPKHLGSLTPCQEIPGWCFSSCYRSPLIYILWSQRFIRIPGTSACCSLFKFNVCLQLNLQKSPPEQKLEW